jgi:hypothetical protein
MEVSDENVKSRQYEPTKTYIIGLVLGVEPNRVLNILEGI